MRDVLVNDYVLQMQGSLRGGMLYLDDCMSVYRMDTPGSWTGKHGRWLDDDHRKLLNRKLDALDAYTDGAWHREITLRKRIYDSNSLLASLRYAALLAPGEIGTTLQPPSPAASFSACRTSSIASGASSSILFAAMICGRFSSPAP